MKITYLKLKNFATIYTAMKLTEIELDLSRCKNRIVIFDGPNGSGKTSILSTLHPFAYTGNLDVRNNTNLIIDEKDGYKEIHINDNSDNYIIIHFYKYTKRGTIVKSFIKKNNEELNPNGNVTSFIEIVKNELSIEQEFLRLIRLGSNVSNLIDMKASERKNYASFLLSDINVFSDLYKKINEDNRLIKNLMKSVADKLNKLNIVDKDTVYEKIKELELTVDKYTNMKNELINKQGNIQGSISSLAPTGINNIYINKDILVKEIDNINRDIKYNTNKLKRICIVTTDIDNDILNMEKMIQINETNINTSNEKILFYKEQLSELYTDKDYLMTKLSTLTSDLEYHQISNFYLEIHTKMTDMKNKFSNYNNIYTKDELMTILNSITQINDILKSTYEFNIKSLHKTIELMSNNIDIDSYVNKELAIIDKNILKITSKFKNNTSKPLIIFKPHNCEVEKCPYLYLYDLLFSDDKEKTSLSSLESKKDFLHDITHISKNISYVLMILNSISNLIIKGDLTFLSMNNIYKTIDSQNILDYEEYITDLISEVEEYNEYVKLKDECKKIEDEIKAINSNKENIDDLKSKIEKVDLKIGKMLTNINKLQNIIDNELDDKSNNESILNMYIKYKEYSSTIQESMKLKIIKTDELIQQDKLIANINLLNTQLLSISKEIDNTDWLIKKTNDELLNEKLTIREFETLSKEQEVLHDKFEDIEIIRESLSSTKGIPLLFIQLYLKNTKIYVNKLLENVYEDFEIDDFEINSTEFNIPYIKNGVRINDVSFASQGEKSFLSLALSFSLIIQSIKKYNILLLDEIDSTFDQKNRAMFLNILEKQMEIVDAEQVFLITHNNMFDNYPVDIISTSKYRVDTYNNGNLIFSL